MEKEIKMSVNLSGKQISDIKDMANEKLVKENTQLKYLLAAAKELIEEPPAKNCTCFINPPCSDCVDYGHLRDILNDINEVLKEE
jgi:hypothetical protein